ncbi:MAG TPA: heavy metal translocating P-type ATPase [Acidobacteriaceae bacterium]|jgi:Cu+-exporting ATPase|nr:heavy metal translocating P-type ATPase [Acidobacteriaceae bacterium]
MTETSPQEMQLQIAGMSCAACQIHVEKALRETAGVTEANVNLLTHTARVTGNADSDHLIAAVRSAGYDASLPDSGMPEHEHGDAMLPRKAVFAFVAGALAMILSMPLMSAGAPLRMTYNGPLDTNIANGNDPLLGWVRSTLDPPMMRFTPWLMHLSATPLRWFLLALTLAVMAWAGSEIYRRAWQAALHRSTNMNTLVALGTGAAFLYSAMATIAPGFFEQRGLSADVYFESVILILAFLLFGNLLDERARHGTTDALRGFAALQPPTARVLRDGTETEIPLHAVITGDILLVKPGERLPVDGIVINGTTSVDESLLTGESLPVPKKEDSIVIGGSMNLDGAIEVRATTVGAASTLAQMMRLMEQAQSAKAPMQRLADRASAIFVPTVLALAVVTFLLWMIFDTPGRAIAVAIAVLVIACPCAMGLAVPAALTVAVGRAAQLGILIKSGEALERLANIDTIAFDKTGTLTMGHPQITGLYLEETSFSREQILRYAASLEARSEHPLAKAVVQYTRVQLLTGESFPAPRNFLALPGRGVSGTMDGHAILLGTSSLLAEADAAPAPIAPTKYTPLHMAIDGAHVATFEAEDTLRPEAAAAVAQLMALDIVVVMLTGDTLAAAHSIAEQAGIDDVRSSLMPADKVAALQSLQDYGHSVAMVGDGVNDAAALAQANVGIAMGTGTDIARAAGGIVLLSNEAHNGLSSLAPAILLARQTTRIMKENLGWAAGYNLLGLPIAAGVLYPAFGILLSPVVASAAMALSSTSVLMNSLRLRGYTPVLPRIRPIGRPLAR